MYLELLAKVLTNSIYESALPQVSEREVTILDTVLKEIQDSGIKLDLSAAALAQILQYTKKSRDIHTYVSTKALYNIRDCIKDIDQLMIPGDVIDCGVLRGGTSIFMAGAIKHYNLGKRVLVADSFQGLPPPSCHESEFAREFWYKYANKLTDYNLSCLASKKDVTNNFEKYDLLSDNVIFMEGWFADTLKNLPPETQLSLIRIDADWYQSTTDAIINTYPYLSSGGYIIIDDYLLEGCRKAVDEYRDIHNIHSPIQTADEESGVIFWQK